MGVCVCVCVCVSVCLCVLTQGAVVFKMCRVSRHQILYIHASTEAGVSCKNTGKHYLHCKSKRRMYQSQATLNANDRRRTCCCRKGQMGGNLQKMLFSSRESVGEKKMHAAFNTRKSAAVESTRVLKHILSQLVP